MKKTLSTIAVGILLIAGYNDGPTSLQVALAKPGQSDGAKLPGEPSPQSVSMTVRVDRLPNTPVIDFSKPLSVQFRSSPGSWQRKRIYLRGYGSWFTISFRHAQGRQSSIHRPCTVFRFDSGFIHRLLSPQQMITVSINRPSSPPNPGGLKGATYFRIG